MRVVDEGEATRRDNQNYEIGVSIADKIFGRERVTACGRDLANRDNFLYINRNEGGKFREYGAEIHLGGAFSQIKVFDESLFSDAVRFGEEYEKMTKEEIILRHNYSAPKSA